MLQAARLRRTSDVDDALGKLDGFLIETILRIANITMVPRDRVCALLAKCNIHFEECMSDAPLHEGLVPFYAELALTQTAIKHRMCAVTILFLAGPEAPYTGGHAIPVDGDGVFLR